MQTILDYAKEIVNEIYKHDDHWDYTIVINPNAIELMEKDLYIPFSIMLSKKWISCCKLLRIRHHRKNIQNHQRSC